MFEELQEVLDQLIEALQARDAATEVMKDAFIALNSANSKYDAATEALAELLGRASDSSDVSTGDILGLFGGGSKGGGFNLPGLSGLNNLFGDLF